MEIHTVRHLHFHHWWRQTHGDKNHIVYLYQNQRRASTTCTRHHAHRLCIYHIAYPKTKKSKKSRNEHINISYRKWKMTLFAVRISTVCIQFRIATKALKFISTSVILCPNHPNIRVIFGLGVNLNNFTHFPSHRFVKEHHL